MDYFDILLAKKLRGGGGGDITIKSLNVTQNGTYSEEGVAYSPVKVNVPLPENAYLLKDIPHTPTAIATFSDGANLPMPKLEVGIEPVQEGSGDPSPENVRPISGWDEVNVTVADDVDNPTVSNVYTIDLDGTRYGGKVDLVSGVMTVDRAIVDISTFTWTSITGGIYAADLLGIAKTYPNGVPNKVIFEKYQSKPSKAGGFYPNEPNVISLNSNGYLYTVVDTSPTGQCVYELATPLTIQLPTTVVKSLRGVNNISADSGDVLDLSYFGKEE